MWESFIIISKHKNPLDHKVFSYDFVKILSYIEKYVREMETFQCILCRYTQHIKRKIQKLKLSYAGSQRNTLLSDPITFQVFLLKSFRSLI